MDRLPEDVRMLINKFAYGSPTARLIKKAPKWKLKLGIYDTEAEYWKDYSLNEIKWTCYLVEDENMTDEEYRRIDDWHTRYLNTWYV